MTLRDFLKRLDDDDLDKMILYSDGEGWTNVWFKKQNDNIIMYDEENEIFSSDK